MYKDYKDISNKTAKLFQEILSEKGMKNEDVKSKHMIKYLRITESGYEKVERFYSQVYRGAKGDKILDFGCGTGRYIYVGKRLGYDVKGIDIMITGDSVYTRARKLYEIEDDVMLYDGTTLPYFEDNTFDGMLFVLSITRDSTLPAARKNMSDPVYKARMNYRIEELIRMSKPDAAWYITKRDHHIIIKPLFDKFNNKNIKIYGAGARRKK